MKSNKPSYKKISLSSFVVIAGLGGVYAVNQTGSTAISDKSVVSSQTNSHYSQASAAADNRSNTQPSMAVTQPQSLQTENESQKSGLDKKALPAKENYAEFIANFFALMNGDPDQLPVEELASLLESDPEFLKMLLSEMSGLGDEVLSASLGHALSGHITMNDRMKAVFSEAMTTQQDEASKLAIYYLLLNINDIGYELQSLVLNDISMQSDSNLIGLGALSLKSSESVEYSHAEEQAITSFLADTYNNEAMDYKTKYYAFSALSTWVDSDEDLYETTQVLNGDKDINMHSVAINSLAKIDSDNSKNQLLDYVYDSSNPCGTRIQAIEALQSMPLEGGYRDDYENAKNSGCYMEYNEINTMEDSEEKYQMLNALLFDS